MNRPYTADYGGRQVDLEWLQSILQPRSTPQRLYMQFAPNTKIVAGMQKMAQRFTNTFLTAAGDVKFDPDFGTPFWSDLFRGVAQNMGRVVRAITQAMLFTLDIMQAEDVQTAVYGELPLDEQIADATLESYSVDRNSGTLLFEIALVNKQGDSYVYTLPVQAVRSGT